MRHLAPAALYVTACAFMIAGCGDKAVPYQPPPHRDVATPAASQAGPNPLKVKVSGNDFNVGFDDRQSFSLGKLPDGCQAVEHATSALTSDLSSIWIVAACASDQWWQTLWIVEAKPPLNIWQRFHFTAAHRAVRLGARLPDKEHFELIITPSSDAGGAPELSVVIPWQLQGRTLARMPEQPERALRIAVDAAQKLRKTNTGAANAQLDAVVQAHMLMCREVAGPKLTIQDSQAGLACGPSQAAALATALRFRQLAEAKQIEEALTLYPRLLSPALAISSDAETVIRAGWNALGSTTTFTLHQGPQVSGLPADGARHALEFLDEQTVLVRQSPPVRFTIGSQDFEPVEVSASHGYVADPKGKFVVVDVHRHCDTYALGLAPRTLLSEPLLAIHPTRSVPFPQASSVTACRSNSQSADNGGWRVVKWTEQGVLVARGSESHLVPIDANGRSAGASVSVSDSLAPSVVGYADSVPGGVMVRLFGSEPHLFLMRPRTWAEQGHQPKHAVLSPSGKRVAVIYQQRLAILERTGV